MIEPIDFEEGFQAIAGIRGWTLGSPDYSIVQSFWIGLQKKMQSLMDTNADGIITMDEWLEYMTSRLDHDFADSFTKLIDSNEDGENSLHKLKMFYQGYKIDTSQAKAVFEQFDINRDGNISQEEISKILDQFMYSDELEESVNLAVAS